MKDVFPGSHLPGGMERGGGGGGDPPQHPKLLERASLPADFLWQHHQSSRLLTADRDSGAVGCLTYWEVRTLLKLGWGRPLRWQQGALTRVENTSFLPSCRLFGDRFSSPGVEREGRERFYYFPAAKLEI